MRATTAAARCVALALVFGDDARLDTGDFRRARGGRDDDHYGVGDAILLILLTCTHLSLFMSPRKKPLALPTASFTGDLAAMELYNAASKSVC